MAKVTSKLASVPSPREQMETRFVELMTELFQLDEAEALDFGLYQVIRRHNREVKAFLGEIVAQNGSKTLQGGRLVELLDAAFAVMGHEAQAEDKLRIKDLEDQLGLRPGMTQAQREDKLTQAENIPAIKGLVAEYRSRIETLAQQQTAHQDRAEVLNRLYQFFSRHYQDGDFIVERRYGKGGSRYVKSTGEDTEFHWATEDMYYIKSGDISTDFPVSLTNGQRLLFTVEPESLKDTRAALKPNDKAHYELDETTKDGDVIKVRLKYLKGAQTEKHKDKIVTAVLTAIQKAGAGGTAEVASDIRRWLNRFITRNQRDFFIHKRLKEALTEDLDIFIKTDLLDVDQLLAGATQQTDLPKRAMKVARLVREIGGHIIDFLAALEDFKKALWEKKKLVLETRYVITLNRLERYCPEWLAKNIDTIVKNQRKEWKELGLGDYANSTACIRKSEGDLATAATEQYLPLPVDTKNFDAEFKWSMLEAITASTPLDEAIDGVAVQSDNWQALNTLREKYHESVKCIYIDPPYNTGGDGFSYKDSYRSASWMAMMEDRLRLGAEIMRADGALFSSIDQNEYPKLRMLLENTFGRGNALGTIVWKNVTDNNPTNVAVEHEYVETFAKNRTLLESEWKSPYSDAKDLLVNLGQELVEKYGDTPALRAAYKDWFKNNKVFLGPLDRYKYIDKDGIYTGSQSVHNPGKEGYRYDIIHPKTEKPCKQPLMGYRFPKETFEKLLADGRIIFGDDETKLIELKVYAHEYEAKLPSVIELDGRSGANDLTNLFGEAQKFKNPKASALLQELVPYAAGKNDLVADFFLGSGTTVHALMRLNRKAALGLRWLGVEASFNFETLVIPRIKKAAFSTEWLKGQPVESDSPGTFMRVQSLEQYDDTLESLDAEMNEGNSGELLFHDPAFALRYRLDKTSRALYCGVDRFAAPFGYQLKGAEGGGEAQAHDVDLVESIPYLLGLDVIRLYREDQGVVLLGRNRRKQSVAVLFRDCTAQGSAEWVKTKLAEHPADRVYTNDPASLSFEGCDQFEAIEAIFALQFGRV